MSLLDDKFTVLGEEPAQGFLRPYSVQTPEGAKGRLFWFEVHGPDARAAFHRYKNAVRRLEAQGLLIQGVLVSANPGRYYVFWPEAKPAQRHKRLKPILDTLEPFGYKEPDLEAAEESGRTLVALLKPQTSAPALPPEPAPINTTPPQPQAEGPEASNPTIPLSSAATAKLPDPPLEPGPLPTPAKPAKARPPRPPRRAYRWNWPGWVPGLLMMAVGGWAAWAGATRYLNPPQYVLPDVVGKTPTQAYDAVRAFGLTVVFSEGSDPSAPKDQVLEQNPDHGTRVKPGRRLELVINKPRFGSVPTVSGRSLDDARQALEAAGYPVKGITRISSGDTADTVLASLPREGTALKAGEPVRLLVASGTRPAPRETLLPDLTGLTEEEAAYILTLAELQPAFVRVASGAPDGVVLGQEPGPGVVLARGARVRVQVGAQTQASVPRASPFEPPRLPEPPPPPPEPEPEPEPVVDPPVTDPNAVNPPVTDPNAVNPTPTPTPTPTPEPTPEPTPAPTPTPTPTPEPTPQPQGPQERRVNVSYTPTVEITTGTVAIVVVQDEIETRTLFEGPVEPGWVYPAQEIIVRGAATFRVLINGQEVLSTPL